MPRGQHLVRLHTTPGVDAVAAARRDLQEVRAVVVVEAERRLGQPGRRVVDGGEVAPDGVGHAVDWLAIDGGRDPLAPRHLLHDLWLIAPRAPRPGPTYPPDQRCRSRRRPRRRCWRRPAQPMAKATCP